ncbi:MAG TPA: hypothetical protein VLF69_04020 [Candidatus Saccharimonadales bacterium]|nr:hypothetical protein [Candidatus Saccharimonadales bacterium]
MTHATLEANSAETLHRSRPESLGMRVMSGEHVMIDVDSSIYPAEAIGLNTNHDNYRLMVIGEIGLDVVGKGTEGRAQTAHAAILKATHKDGTIKYAVQGLDVDETGRATALPLGPVVIDVRHSITLGEAADEPRNRQRDTSLVSAGMIWGRGTWFADSIAPKHLTIRAEKRALHIEDHSSTGTLLQAELYRELEYQDDYTQAAIHLASVMRLLDERGLAGRKIITRDTTIGGPNPEASIDIRSWVAGGEVVIVDSSEAPEFYDKLRGDMLQKLADIREQQGGKISEEDVLQAIEAVVAETITYDLPWANATADRLAKSQGNQGYYATNLAYFLRSGKGACRHMALAAAWLGGEAASQGLLSGRMTTDVSQRSHGSTREAHEWARYTLPDGSVYIIDPTPSSRYVGRLEDSRTRHGWEYFRPKEKVAYLTRLMHGKAIGRADFVASRTDATGPQPVRPVRAGRHEAPRRQKHRKDTPLINLGKLLGW